MMKIHTTQNLSVLAQQQQLSTNGVSSKESAFGNGNVTSKNLSSGTNYKLINTGILLSGLAIIGLLSAALARKSKTKINPEELKKAVRTIKDVKVGNIKEKATPEFSKYDKFLDSKFFDTLLRLAENEPVVQSAMAALICIILRPATIMALPNKKGKDDNKYASAHAISSGIIGLFATFLIAQPFKLGASYTMNNQLKNFSEDALKRLSPKLDIKSIYKDSSKTARKEVNEWLFNDGNKFVSKYKNVEKIPILKPFNEISAESFKAFNADVDWVSQKGKSFNDVITKDGKRLYDVIDGDRLGIIVDQVYTGVGSPSEKILKESTGSARVLLKDMDREFLEKIVKDANDTSNWKKLDVNSVYKDNQVVDFRKWKDIEGNQWKLDLDNTYISSPYDTATYVPRISGKHRIEPTGEVKYAAYLKNGKNGKLGSIIDESMAATDKRNEVLDKLLTWTPDIATRPLVATTTISLIPLVLLKVFHLQKSVPSPAKTATPSFKGKDGTNEDTENNSITFKGTAPSGAGAPKEPSLWNRFVENFIAKPLSKIYGKPMYESKLVGRISNRLSKVPGGMTNHMATLGALLTSSVYMYQTLNKKDLDDDRKRTLAVNQALCFIVPTICAYTVDKLLKNWTKEKIEYPYAGKQEQRIAMAKLNKKPAGEIEALEKDLGKKLNGVRTVVSLAIFALIYRYIAPVLITPLANKIGERINEKRHAKLAENSVG